MSTQNGGKNERLGGSTGSEKEESREVQKRRGQDLTSLIRKKKSQWKVMRDMKGSIRRLQRRNPPYVYDQGRGGVWIRWWGKNGILRK